MKLKISETDNSIKNEQLLKEMSCIGTIGKNIGQSGAYEVWIYSQEGGNIPHFYVINREEKFECCVKIKECDYFHYGARKLNKILEDKIDNLVIDSILNNKKSIKIS